VKPFGARDGVGFWRPAPPDPMASCSACSSRIRRSCRRSRFRRRVSLQSLRCRRRECTREHAAALAAPELRHDCRSYAWWLSRSSIGLVHPPVPAPARRDGIDSLQSPLPMRSLKEWLSARLVGSGARRISMAPGKSGRQNAGEAVHRKQATKTGSNRVRVRGMHAEPTAPATMVTMLFHVLGQMGEVPR
jgi:hypothetical protein